MKNCQQVVISSIFKFKTTNFQFPDHSLGSSSFIP